MLTGGVGARGVLVVLAEDFEKICIDSGYRTLVAKFTCGIQLHPGDVMQPFQLMGKRALVSAVVPRGDALDSLADEM